MQRGILALGTAALLATFAHLVACSSDEPQPPQPPPSTGDVDAGSPDVVAEGESLTVLVVGLSASKAKAVSGATVIFDKPSGERVETESGADGLVTLTGIDWSKGSAALSVFAPGTTVTSFVELTKERIPQLQADFSAVVARDIGDTPRRDLTIIIGNDESKNPTLSGTVSNATGSRVILSTSVGGGFQWQGSPGPYALKVEPGVPFSIISAELSLPGTATVGPRGREADVKRWAKIDHPAVDADTTFDVDLATASPLVPTKVEGKMVLPGGDAGPLGGGSNGLVFVRTNESNAATLAGHFRKIDISADGNAFEFELEYVPIEGATLATEAVIQVPSGGVSIALATGTPAQGMTIDGFLPTPELKSPKRSLSEPFSLEGIPDGARARISFVSSRGEPRWFVECPHGVTSVTLPTIDGALETALGRLAGGNISWQGALVENIGYTRFSASPTFLLE